MPAISDSQLIIFVALFVIGYARQWVKYQQYRERCHKLELEIMVLKKQEECG